MRSIVLSKSVVFNSVIPWTVCSLWDSSVHGIFQAKILQGIFPTQGSNLHLLHWRADSFTTVPPGMPQQTGNVIQIWTWAEHSVQFSSVTQSCPTLRDPMNRSTPGLPVHHQLPEPTQTHVHWVGDAIQTSHPLSSPSLPALNLSQHQSLFKWVSSSHHVAKVMEFQLQHQSFQWTRTDLL